jgi:hypothetical protein
MNRRVPIRPGISSPTHLKTTPFHELARYVIYTFYIAGTMGKPVTTFVQLFYDVIVCCKDRAFWNEIIK